MADSPFYINHSKQSFNPAKVCHAMITHRGAPNAREPLDNCALQASFTVTRQESLGETEFGELKFMLQDTKGTCLPAAIESVYNFKLTEELTVNNLDINAHARSIFDQLPGK